MLLLDQLGEAEARMVSFAAVTAVAAGESQSPQAVSQPW